MEEGRKSEEILKKQCLEKEEQHQVEVNILKGKLEDKDKLLRFQDSAKVLDDILGVDLYSASLILQDLLLVRGL